MTNAIEEFSDFAQIQMPVIYRFLLASLRDKDLAETLTQECFLKAYRNRTGFRGESSARTWLMRIAINLKKDHWRSRKTQFWRETQASAMNVECAIDLLTSKEPSPEAQVIARDQTAQIWSLIERLSMRERSVFLLRYVEELELGEIGQRIGLKTGAVKAYLRRAHVKIRKTLKGSEMYLK